jgi:hypothetical protein
MNQFLMKEEGIFTQTILQPEESALSIYIEYFDFYPVEEYFIPHPLRTSLFSQLSSYLDTHILLLILLY